MSNVFLSTELIRVHFRHFHLHLGRKIGDFSYVSSAICEMHHDPVMIRDQIIYWGMNCVPCPGQLQRV